MRACSFGQQFNDQIAPRAATHVEFRLEIVISIFPGNRVHFDCHRRPNNPAGRYPLRLYLKNAESFALNLESTHEH